MIFKNEGQVEIEQSKLYASFLKKKAHIEYDTFMLELEFDRKKQQWDQKLLEYERETLNKLKNLEHEFHSSTEELNKVQAKLESTIRLNQQLQNKFSLLIEEKDDRIKCLNDTLNKLLNKLQVSITIE